MSATPRHRRDLDGYLAEIVPRLAADQPLPESKLDHALSGEWNGHRECHVKPDLLLIYEKLDDDVVRLVRLGSHSELFR